MIRLEYRRADVSLVVELEDIPGGEVHVDPYVVAWSSALDRLAAAEIAHIAAADPSPGGAYCVECKLPLVGHVVDIGGHLMHRHCQPPEEGPTPPPPPPQDRRTRCAACGVGIPEFAVSVELGGKRYHEECLPPPAAGDLGPVATEIEDRHPRCFACGDSIHGSLFVAAGDDQVPYHGSCVPVDAITRRGRS